MPASIYGDPGTLYGTAIYGAEADPVQFTPAELRVELFYVGRWVNHTTDVRTETGVRYGRGRASEDAESSPSWCNLTFDNTDGLYSPRNTGSGLYGYIGRNTRVRVGFGSPVVGEVRTANGTLGAITQSTGYGDVGVMAVGLVMPVDNLTTPAGYGTATEYDATAFTVKRCFTTDADLVPASAFTAAGSPTEWATAHVAVPGGTLVASDGSTANAGNSPAGASVAGLDAGDILVAVCAWTSDVQGRMGPPVFSGGVVPPELYLVADTGPGDGPRIAVWAWAHREGHSAVSFVGAEDGVSGATFQISVWTGADGYAPQFCGEVADWPLAWSKGEHEKTTAIRASGVQRRIAQSQDEISALRRALSNHADIVHYWPMEDPDGSTSFAPAVGTIGMVAVNGVDPAEVDAVAGSAPLPSFTGRGARGRVAPANTAPWGFGGVVAIPTAGTAAGTNLLVGECGVGGDLSSFGLEYTNSTTLTIKASYTDGTSASSSFGSLTSAFAGGIDGRQMFVYVGLSQSGANIAWAVTVVNATADEESAGLTTSGSILTKTLGPLAAVTACVEAGNSTTIGTNDISAGHVFVTASATFEFSVYRAQSARGFAGSLISEAALVVARDAGYLFGLTIPSTDTLTAAPIELGTTFGQLRSLAEAGQALMSDAAGFPGLEWRPITAVQSQEPMFTFDYDAGTFTDPFTVVDDDQLALNDATVESTAGGSGRVVVEVGALGAQPGGVGRYANTFRLPVADADAARDLAGWLTNLGTFDEPRWPEVTLEMSGPGNAALPMGSFSIGDTIRLDNLPSFQGPTSVDLVVVGFTGEVDSALWRVTLITRPAGPYRVLTWDDAEFGVWADADNPSADDNRWSL